MGDGTEQNPYTREDVLRLIKQKGDVTRGLDLFSGKEFEEGIDLSNQVFCGIILNDTILIRANFNGCDLNDAVIQRANLQGATFNPLDGKEATLTKVDMRGSYLKNAEFRGADLSGAQFQEDPEKLLRANLEETDFRHANLFGANFKECHFYRTKLEKARICSTDIAFPPNRLGEADWGNYIIGEEEDRDFYNARHLYRQLKVWYTNAGYHDTAAKFYYREKEANRKSLKWHSRHRLALEVLRALFGYGEDWKRVLYWMALVVFGAAVAYLFGGLNPLYSLYFSVISFTALGYGKWVDITPEGWVQALGAVESFTGVFLMALLLVTFFRKWTR